MVQTEGRTALTFTYLHAQIEALPEGPVSVLRSPGWTRSWTIAGVVGMLLALLPSLLVQWLQPAWWMVTVGRIGLAVAIIGFAPGFIRDVWVIFRQFRHQRRGFVEQFDHDAAHIHALAVRLSAYPRDVLERQRRFAVMGHARMESRLMMMLGGIERLGLLPLLLSLFVLLRNWRDLLALPFWLTMLAAMAAILWVIGWWAAEFRRRLQLYEFVLDEALHHQSAATSHAREHQESTA